MEFPAAYSPLRHFRHADPSSPMQPDISPIHSTLRHFPSKPCLQSPLRRFPSSPALHSPLRHFPSDTSPHPTGLLRRVPSDTSTRSALRHLASNTNSTTSSTSYFTAASSVSTSGKDVRITTFHYEERVGRSSEEDPSSSSNGGTPALRTVAEDLSEEDEPLRSTHLLHRKISKTFGRGRRVTLPAGSTIGAINTDSGNIRNSEINGCWNKYTILQFFGSSSMRASGEREPGVSAPLIIPTEMDPVPSSSDLALPSESQAYFTGFLRTISEQTGLDDNVWSDQPELSQAGSGRQTSDGGPDVISELIDRLTEEVVREDEGATSVDDTIHNHDQSTPTHSRIRQINTATMHNSTSFQSNGGVHMARDYEISGVRQHNESDIVKSLRNVESSIAMSALLSSVQSEMTGLQISRMSVETRLAACQDEAARFQLLERLSTLDRELSAAKQRKLDIESNIISRLSATPTTPSTSIGFESVRVGVSDAEGMVKSSGSWARSRTTRIRNWLKRKASFIA